MTISFKLNKEHIPSWARTVAVGIDSENCFKEENKHISNNILFNNHTYEDECFNSGGELVDSDNCGIDFQWFKVMNFKVLSYIYNLGQLSDLLPEKYSYVYFVVFDLETEQKFLHLYNNDSGNQVTIKLPENIKINLIIS